jgi:hypothetical protein
MTRRGPHAWFDVERRKGMKMHIHLDLDKDAFTKDQGREIARILRAVAEQAEERDGVRADTDIGLYDVNGNLVGRAVVTV